VNESSKTKPVFRKVGKTQNLYRHAKSGVYYSLIKRSGKQFRHNLNINELLSTMLPKAIYVIS